MKQSVKFLILLAALAVLIPLSVFGYNRLSADYEAPTNDSSFQTEPSSQTLTKATDFTVIDINSKEVKLSDYFGKPIIINFWATWCGPCKSELPAFDQASKKYGEEIQFLMVNLTDGSRDTVEKVKSFISDYEYSFPVFFDTQFSGANAYAVSSIPMTVVIDKDGNVIDTYVGAMSAATLDEYINRILGGD